MAAPDLTAVTDATFDALAGPGSGTVVVDFSTESCAPCHTLQRVLGSLRPHLPDDVRILTVAADENPRLVGAFDVSTVPTLVILRDGEPVERLTGVDRPQVVRSAILKHHGGEE